MYLPIYDVIIMINFIPYILLGHTGTSSNPLVIIICLKNVETWFIIFLGEIITYVGLSFSFYLRTVLPVMLIAYARYMLCNIHHII